MQHAMKFINLAVFFIFVLLAMANQRRQQGVRGKVCRRVIGIKATLQLSGWRRRRGEGGKRKEERGGKVVSVTKSLTSTSARMRQAAAAAAAAAVDKQ